ncbi:hypothetical protein [Campylobacter sp. CCS1377]|uniref:Uncharacterized protein n=1 Tax=Campylobacter sp. CCS1377 TaxID=3158229 RepID=A0AAU7E6X7_9BACT
MTKKQFNEIKEQLKVWREERHLTYKNQRKGFLGNVFEEISEYFRAKDDLERIDALCDIAVFCFNVNNIKYSNYECFVRSNKVEFDDSEIILKINSIIIGRVKFNTDFVRIALDTLIALLYKKCEELKFDFYKCMEETIKEISSRTGKYDESIGKFVKDEGAYSIDEAIKEAVKKFEVLNNTTNCALLKENNNFWYIKCEDGYKGRYEEIAIKKWHKADYESCRVEK